MRFFFVSIFYLCLIIQPVFGQNNIEIKDAWLSEAPPVVNILAGYITIMNHSDQPMDLVAAQSPVFERIEFHLTKTDDGVARMQKETVITIPAQSEFRFSPGEYHLMLFNPVKPLKSGDLVSLQLTFSQDVRIDVEAEVKRSEHFGHHTH